jgi:hypothetical protein
VLDHHNGHRKPEEQTVVHLIQSLPDLPMGLKEPLALCSSPHLPLCDLWTVSSTWAIPCTPEMSIVADKKSWPCCPSAHCWFIRPHAWTILFQQFWNSIIFARIFVALREPLHSGPLPPHSFFSGVYPAPLWVSWFPYGHYRMCCFPKRIKTLKPLLASLEMEVVRRKDVACMGPLFCMCVGESLSQKRNHCP